MPKLLRAALESQNPHAHAVDKKTIHKIALEGVREHQQITRQLRVALESGQQINVQEVWHSLEAHLKEIKSDAFGDLNPPATSSQIHEAEKFIGVTLPPELVQLLKIHNGQEQFGDALFHQYYFCSTDEMQGETSTMKELLDGGDFDDHEEVNADPGVRKEWWNPKWVAFGIDGGGATVSVST